MSDLTNGVPLFPMVRKDPFDPPKELLRLRHERPAPVQLWDGTTPWLFTSHEAVRAVLSDPRLSVNRSLPGFPLNSKTSAANRTQGKAFIAMDDPEHAVQRAWVATEFNVRRMEQLRPRIQEIVNVLVDEMLDGPKPADLVDALALPVPSLVICEILGVPYQDRAFFRRISAGLLAFRSTPDQYLATILELAVYLGDLIDAKAEHPADDLLSRSAANHLLTGEATRDELIQIAGLLLIAGYESTANMIGLGTALLLENPDQMAELASSRDPKLAASATEELLRYLSIVHTGLRRVAVGDVEVGGVCVAAGEGVIAALDAANRDGRAFPDPDRFDIHRDARHHVAFGHGIHQCVAQTLARVELQVVFGTIFQRVPTLALAVPLKLLPFKRDALIYGVTELPVRW